MILHCSQSLSNQTDILDIIFKVAAIVIALFNIVITYYIFSLNQQNSDVSKEQERKMKLLKTLILDQNLKFLYDFIDQLELNLNILTNSVVSQNEKENLIEETDELFIMIRRKFVDTLLAVDNSLYSNILSKFDELQGKLYENIFNNGLNLTDKAMYNTTILKPITEAKTEILKFLFNYKG